MNTYKSVDDKIFEKAVEFNKLEDVLSGIGPYKIYSNNMNREAIVNTGPIMRKIYDYYLDNPRAKVDKKMQNALENLSQYKDFLSIYTVLEFEDYQLSNEKNGTAPFWLNHLIILEKLRKNLQKNRDIFYSHGFLEHYELDNGLSEYIEQYDEKFERDYGYKII